jgi:hypothetical protein
MLLKIEDAIAFFTSEVINQMLRVSKIIFYNIQIVTGTKRSTAIKIIGKKFYHKNIKYIIVWDKGHGQPNAHRCVKSTATQKLALD